MIKSQKYTLGLDIGIASVGWCLLGENRIIDLGVRAFNKAEDEKGKALNADRREKRSTRKRLKRRRQRLYQARTLFVEYGLLATNKASQLMIDSDQKVTPWQLRCYGLDQKLTPLQFAQALYHIVKYRGFRSMRKGEEQSSKQSSEEGRLLSGVSSNSLLLKSGEYRTPAEIACKHPDYQAHQRNKRGDYNHTFARRDLIDEIKQLFDAQRALGNALAEKALQDKISKLVWEQKPALSGDAILELIGFCTFEKEEKRAPKAGYYCERFMWLQKLNNITVYERGGQRRHLTEAEKAIAREEPYNKTRFSYKQLRALLEKKLGFDSGLKFSGVSYGANDRDSVESKANAVEFKFYHSLKKRYKDNDLISEWQVLSCDRDTLDAIGYALTIYKTDDDIRGYLKDYPLSEQEVNILLTLSFQKVGHLSLAAIKKILPYLEQGLRYDEAASKVYKDFRAIVDAKKQKLLPPIDKDDIRNPVVFRGLNQARKVINAIIKQYGSPMAVHIELARELSLPFDERKRIEREQKKYREEKLAAITHCKEVMRLAQDPKGLELLKFRLYKQQDGKCAYSLQELDVGQLFDSGYVEVDHALPYSRSYDDSLNNKVLVFSAENRNKGNKTPYEYLGGASQAERWRDFQNFVITNTKYRQAKRNRLLKQELPTDDTKEFKDRNLNDTRYIGRYLKNQIETYLSLNAESKSERCLVVQGKMTSFLRTRWGVLKVREASDLHHAVDAAVVAACSHAMVKHISDYSRLKELAMVERGYRDPVNGEVIDIAKLRQLENRFPQPWSDFRDELKARLSANPKVLLDKLPHYQPEDLDKIKPVLVSRAPQRRNKGSAHKETVSSKKLMQGDKPRSTIRTPLTKLKLSNLENMVGKDDPRNQPLYQLLKKRLEEFKGKGGEAFEDKQPPVFRPRQDGTFSSNVVKSIKLATTQKSGLFVRQGIADNDSMLRVDVFYKNKKYFLVPIYVADLGKKELPNKAISAYKPESNWLDMTDKYKFKFSLYPNDFLVLNVGGKSYSGYFSGADRATGAISIWAHDRDEAIGKNGLIRGIGIKSSNVFQKYHVDVLGNLYIVQEEVRNDLAQYRNHKG